MLFNLYVVTIAIACAAAWACSRWLRNTGWLLSAMVSLAGGLMAAGLFWVLILAIFFVAAIEPWPLSLRQGPDTEFAKVCYAEFIGEPPPPDVTRIFCRKEWGFGGDSVHSLRFAFGNRSTVSAIVKRLDLDAVSPAERAAVRYLSGPRWWPPERTLSGARDVYQKRRIDFLWVDAETREAYFQRAHF